MTLALRDLPPALRIAGYGFLFWLAFLMTLEPALIQRAAESDRTLSFDEEAARILSASLLAALTAPLQHALMQRLGARQRSRVAKLAMQAAACVGLALALIVIAFAGAPLILAPDNPRLARPLSVEIGNNLLLLSFALGAFALLLHLVRRRETPPPTAAPTTRLSVQTRTGALLIDVATIDWIGAEGNYAALHVGAEVYLIRETITRLLGRLDAASFIRIHRGVIVNLARLKRVKPLQSGDAFVVLANGEELRASRTFAGGLRERLHDR